MGSGGQELEGCPGVAVGSGGQEMEGCPGVAMGSGGREAEGCPGVAMGSGGRRQRAVLPSHLHLLLPQPLTLRQTCPTGCPSEVGRIQTLMLLSYNFQVC